MSAMSEDAQVPRPQEPVKEQQQPKTLSEADKRACNHMADTMQLYHNHFKAEWNSMYSALSPDEKGAKKLSASQLVRTGLSFCQHLEMHHGIEERHIFPILAQRMPSFRQDSTEGPIQQHREMHAGIVKLQTYLRACQTGEQNLRREQVKEICDLFGTVLWAHLDDEIEELGWQNMTKYWSKEEIRAMPM